MESLIFLLKKRNGTTKGRIRANGSTQRSFVPREKSLIPAVTTEFVLMISVREAKQERDIMLMDIPNGFVQTKVPQGDEIIIMEIRGALLCMLLCVDPENKKTS